MHKLKSYLSDEAIELRKKMIKMAADKMELGTNYSLDTYDYSFEVRHWGDWEYIGFRDANCLSDESVMRLNKLLAEVNDSFDTTYEIVWLEGEKEYIELRFDKKRVS